MAEVKVRITDELGGNETITKNVSSSPVASVKETQVAQDSTQVAQSQKASKSLAIASMLGKQAFNYAVSNVGKWLGDKHVQATINNATEMVGYGILAYINPALAVAAVGVRVATAAADQAWENKQNEIASQRKLARAGFNSVGEAIGFRR